MASQSPPREMVVASILFSASQVFTAWRDSDDGARNAAAYNNSVSVSTRTEYHEITYLSLRQVFAIVGTRRRADVVQCLDKLVRVAAHEPEAQVEHGGGIGGAHARESGGNRRTRLEHAEGAFKRLAHAEGAEHSEVKARCEHRGKSSLSKCGGRLE